ncbi:polyhydroxyalkanoate synthesis repressor PhaR [Sphaerotilus uruguayifluvii]|uniref:Polyhydroxyalkanoate synthesis repressor PhaR n=1 Tax=Sphaerotilus uruguayifluvii TaxID=2735897 RepID=A0ABX2G5J5_9BURK|nr:polyhydroxyalkanoate synthesis repressor PhaR [Leptothrix sp. C29]NRT57596.1 polyhydroxyalkanoate synthesis repressor PhaR [Leptothrix sp. C29]
MPSNRRTAETEAEPGRTDGPRVLKKYPNRRLYDTRTSSYITLSDVKQMVLDAENFEVRDAKSGEDLTRSILLQIILEEESAGMPMFSTQMLAQIIRFYGHTMQGLMGAYLEKNLLGFVEMHKRFTEQTGGLYEGQAFNPEAWTQFMSMQAPVMQNMMSSYLDQSKTLFAQMQEQMQKQAESFFPGMAGFTPPKTDKG